MTDEVSESEVTKIRSVRWIRASYSGPPSVVAKGPRGAIATAEIECWGGTADEFVYIARVMPADTRFDISVTDVDGQVSKLHNLYELRRRLDIQSATQLLAIRVEAISTTGERAVVVLRARIPGLSIAVDGPNEASALGLAELLFQRAMIGYVDRLGGYRAPASMLLALSPVLLAVLIASALEVSGLVKFGTWIIAAALAVFALNVALARMLIDVPFELHEQLPTRPLSALRLRIRVVLAYRYSRPTLVAIGSLILGVAGNEIADLIHFPWE